MPATPASSSAGTSGSSTLRTRDHGRDVAAHRGLRDVADRLGIEQRVLQVDPDEVVAAGAGSPHDLARTRQPNGEAERRAACAHQLRKLVCHMLHNT